MSASLFSFYPFPYLGPPPGQIRRQPFPTSICGSSHIHGIVAMWLFTFPLKISPKPSPWQKFIPVEQNKHSTIV